MVTSDDLRQLADQAHRYLYKEFEQLLPGLPGDSPARRLAMRLTIFPTSNPWFWSVVKSRLLGEIDETLLDTLYQHQVLESVDPPSYGHDKRWEAARQWCYETWRIGFKREAEQMILVMGADVHAAEERVLPLVTGLAVLVADARAWGLSPLPQALCQCAASLIGQLDAVDADNLLRAIPNADLYARSLIAMGLVNTLNHAKAEENLPRRDALLEELRALAAHYPDDAAVREQLAMGVFNTLNHAKAEEDLPRRDALLEELRALAAHYPDDAAVREQLTRGVFNTLNDAKAEEDLPRRDALLEELRTLAAHYPDDAGVREQLARGVFNTLNHAKAEEDLPWCDELLGELNQLTARFSNEPALQEIARLLFL